MRDFFTRHHWAGDAWRWHVLALPAADEAGRAVVELAGWVQDMLAGCDAVHPVPARWLHCTLLSLPTHITDKIDLSDLAAALDARIGALAPADPVWVGPAEIRAAAVGLHIGTTSDLVSIASAAARAAADILNNSGHPDQEWPHALTLKRPHITVAYGARDVDDPRIYQVADLCGPTTAHRDDRPCVPWRPPAVYLVRLVQDPEAGYYRWHDDVVPVPLARST